MSLARRIERRPEQLIQGFLSGKVSRAELETHRDEIQKFYDLQAPDAFGRRLRVDDSALGDCGAPIAFSAVAIPRFRAIASSPPQLTRGAAGLTSREGAEL